MHNIQWKDEYLTGVEEIDKSIRSSLNSSTV
jgi:hypothetical protein